MIKDCNYNTFKIEGDYIRCILCPNMCLLSEGSTGKCKIRLNTGMSLKLINYGEIVCSRIDDIKDRPISNFIGESKSLSLGMTGCNNTCPFCQNYKISQSESYNNKIFYPEDIVKEAIKNNVNFISFTFTEPIVWIEYIIDVFKISKKEGIKICVKTSGNISNKMIELFLDMIDIINVDIKPIDNNFDKKCGIIDRDIPLSLIYEAKKRKIHTEISYLIIEGVNDKNESMSLLYSEMKKHNIQDIYVNFIKHYPSWKSRYNVTSENTIRKSKENYKKEVNFDERKENV